MKSLVCVEPGVLALERRPRPTAPAPGFATVAVRHVGICGTDYHIFEGKHPFLAYPRVIGHEISGLVTAVGDGVALRPGTPVVVNPYLSCGRCKACRNGKPNCCAAIEVLGVHTDGAMCEEIVVPAGNLYPAGDLSLRDAAMVEFLAIGAHAVRRAVGRGEVQLGAAALVVGAGPIGLGTALFARIAGFDVTLADMSRDRLDAARDRLGFDRGLVAGPDLAAEVDRLTAGEGFDVVFDATGNVAAMEAGLAWVANGGTYVLVSVVRDRIGFADPEFHKRETTLLGSRNATREDFEHVMRSIAAGRVPLDALATHATTLDRVVDDLPVWAKTKSGLIKAIVDIG